MRVTLGTIIWTLSFIVFLIVSYNLSLFERVWDTTFGDLSLIVKVDEFKQTTESTADERVAASHRMSEDSTAVTNINDVLGTVGAIGNAFGVESGDIEIDDPIINTDLYMKVERLSWELEQVDEKLIDMKVRITELTAEKDSTIENLLTILGALTPLLLPFITRKFKSHNTQITLGKK